MKKLTLTFCALFALFAAAPAIFADGPEQYSGKKEVMQPAPAVCDFYRAHEWDLGIWASWSFAADTGHFDVPEVDPFTPDTDPSTFDIATGFFGEQLSDNPKERINLGQWSKNQLWARDDSWGGGVDVKYFWSRYFGLGVIDGGATTYKYFNERPVATAPGTTLPGGAAILYPGGISPYTGLFVTNEQEFWTTDAVPNHHVRGLGQLGLGLEFRVTCHIGLMADF